jgi:hypothetical protein
MTCVGPLWTVRGNGYGRAASLAGSSEKHLEDLTFIPWSSQMHYMYEALARDRQREQQERAAQNRLASELASARLWQRLSAYSARRAARSQRRLAEHAAAEYQLAA